MTDPDCTDPACGYQEPHPHGFDCERTCPCGLWMPAPSEALTAAQLEMLDRLDAQAHPSCAVKSLPHAAEVALRCRGCSQSVVLICRHHALLYAASQAAKAIQQITAGGMLVNYCANCHRTTESFDELVEVVEL